MTRNMGTADRAIRAIVGIALILLALFSGWGIFNAPLWKGLALVIGVVFVGTSAISWCPLYTLFGIKTCRS